MDEADFPSELEKIKKDDIPEIFELVKKAVLKVTGGRRTGMMLALADLGEGENFWIGGYHIMTSNAIVMNTRSLDYITENHPNLLKYYTFEILMHEYLHTLGIMLPYTPLHHLLFKHLKTDVLVMTSGNISDPQDSQVHGDKQDKT